jgi:hypothetical protein
MSEQKTFSSFQNVARTSTAHFLHENIFHFFWAFSNGGKIPKKQPTAIQTLDTNIFLILDNKSNLRY